MENISLIEQGIFFKEGQKPLKGGAISTRSLSKLSVKNWFNF